MSSDDISSDSEDISTDAPTGEAVSYTVTITDNGDGTVTVVAAVPDGITSGKIVVSVSDKLSLVPDSISSDAVYGVAVNESYDRGGIMGACVSFASYSVLYEDTVAFKATYTVAEGAVIDASDITVPQWNLGLYGSVVADQDDRDVIKIFNSASSDDTSDDDIPYIASGTWGKLSWVIDAEYTLTVGGEGSMDNFDSASADAWLEYRDYIKAVVIEDGVTGIGSYAFADLGALASVTVGSGVITVGYNAFYNSNSLAVLYIKSPYTAATLTNGASNGYIALNAQTVAIDISISQVANYIKNNFTHIETFTYKQTGYTCYSKHQHDWEEHSIPALGCTVRGFEGYKCAVCGAINGNDVAIHTYSDVCDAVCNLCGEKRNSPHNYDKEWQYGNTDHWHECTLCGERKDIDPHYYESPCDTECHLCGAVRQAPHSYTELWEKDGEGHWLICEGCGDIAMADTHQYDDSCDDACNFCGTVREVTHSYMGCWTEEGRFYQCVQCGCKTAQMPEDYVLKLAPGADCTLKGGFVITQATLPTAQTVKEFFEAEVSVLDVNGNALAAEELVGTGCKAALCDGDGKVIDYVVIVISGDVDGDAKLTATDYIALEHSLKNPKNTVDCYTKACDITDDGLLSTADLIALKIKLFY